MDGERGDDDDGENEDECVDDCVGEFTGDTNADTRMGRGAAWVAVGDAISGTNVVEDSNESEL